MQCGDHSCPDPSNLHYVMDARGIIWRVTNDGVSAEAFGGDGMVYSAEIQWLALRHGPLWTVEPQKVDRIRFDPAKAGRDKERRKPRRDMF